MLLLDFIGDGSDDAPLLRFSGHDPAACRALYDAFNVLARGETAQIDLGAAHGVTAHKCRLTASAGARDRGVISSEEPSAFEWILTPESWDNVAGLVEPFCIEDHYGGFQWLEDCGDVAVLISQDGVW